MEEFAADGRARSIGVSNFQVEHLRAAGRRVRRDAGGQPDRAPSVLPQRGRPRLRRGARDRHRGVVTDRPGRRSRRSTDHRDRRARRPHRRPRSSSAGTSSGQHRVPEVRRPRSGSGRTLRCSTSSSATRTWRRSRASTRARTAAPGPNPDRFDMIPSYVRREQRPVRGRRQPGGGRHGVALVDPALLARPPAFGQRRRSAVGARGAEVRAVLAEDRLGPSRAIGAAVPRDDGLDPGQQRARAARASPGRRRASRRPRSSGSRRARGSRHTRACASHGITNAVPSAVWPPAGWSSNSRPSPSGASPSAEPPGTGSSCTPASASGPGRST